MAVLRKRGGIIPAEKVQKAIENGDDIDFDEKVTISGNLDIKTWNLPEITSQCLGAQRKLISSSIKIKNSKIKGKVNFSGSWFLNPLKFINTDFLGYVDFSKSKIGYIIFSGSAFFSEHTARFNNISFINNANFSGVSFKAVDFEGSKFYSVAKFDGSNFEQSQFDHCEFYGETSFTHAQFDGITFFSHAKFQKPIDSPCYIHSSDFCHAVFAKGVHFDDAEFGNSVCFTWAKFISESPRFEAAYFVGAEFKEGATFWETVFDGIAHFGSTIFFHYADFKNTNFKDSADFGGACFYGHAIFTGVRFYEKAYFYETSFWKNFILIGTRAYEVRLRDIHVLGCSCISLTYPELSDEIEKLRLEPACMWDERCLWTKALLWSRSCISLDDSGITHLFVRWDTIKDHIAYNPSVYLFLVKSFKDSGQFSEADSCYYQYRDLSQKKKSWSVSKIKDLLADFYYGYEVKPFRALRVWALAIGIAAILFFIGNGTYDFNSLYISLYNSTLIFTSNAKSIKWEHWYLNILGLLEGLIGWLLMALFLVTLGRNRPR